MPGSDILARFRRPDRLALAGVLAAITVVSLVPVGEVEASAGGLDIVAHLAMYGVLGWAGRRAGSGSLATLGAVTLAAGYGGLMEGLQGMVGRDPGWSDWVADVVGGVGGAVAAAFAARTRGESR